jgi:hypothetical protein
MKGARMLHSHVGDPRRVVRSSEYDWAKATQPAVLSLVRRAGAPDERSSSPLSTTPRGGARRFGES